ncbi:hypothetical protein [Paenibacillus graminis]|uniref:CN hydrolase domain-containing protein n=1 Tax=Paenibacillus graminis TaxID=189425 RepID=A0A089MF15_9BACL|nr:hypothetical protein [Paenibacillus graminis]AIQ70073.1 hypothetical protein PGRAT_22290 [Paenibacillus graminis]
MNLLVSQPDHEADMLKLQEELRLWSAYCDAVLYPEGYVADTGSVQTLRSLARHYRKLMMTSYKDGNGKDRALMIGPDGEIVLERAKSPMQGELYTPSVVEAGDIKIGYLLCVEILQGLSGLEGHAGTLDFIAHPIGPISYCIKANGQPLYISHADTRSRIVDLKSGTVVIAEKGTGPAGIVRGQPK